MSPEQLLALLKIDHVQRHISEAYITNQIVVIINQPSEHPDWAHRTFRCPECGSSQVTNKPGTTMCLGCRAPLNVKFEDVPPAFLSMLATDMVDVVAAFANVGLDGRPLLGRIILGSYPGVQCIIYDTESHALLYTGVEVDL